jgi:hypothetical protein
VFGSRHNICLVSRLRVNIWVTPRPSHVFGITNVLPGQWMLLHHTVFHMITRAHPYTRSKPLGHYPRGVDGPFICVSRRIIARCAGLTLIPRTRVSRSRERAHDGVLIHIMLGYILASLPNMLHISSPRHGPSRDGNRASRRKVPGGTARILRKRRNCIAKPEKIAHARKGQKIVCKKP